MRTKKALLLFLILAAGCAETPKDPGIQIEPGIVPNSGVIILYFLPDYPDLYSKDNFRLSLMVQNVGEAKATNVKAELQKYGGFTISGLKQVKMADNLEAPDLQSNSPGETAEADWQLQTPQSSTSFTYSFGTKVKYDYRTEAWTDAVVLSRERWKTLNQLGKAIQINTGASTGPLQVEVSTREAVLPTVAGIATKTFPVQIKLQNAGSGVVNSDINSCSTQGVGCVDSVYLYLPTGDPTASFSIDSCSPAYTKTATPDTITVTFPNVTLMGGSTAYLSCNILASADLLAKPDLEKSILIKAAADYRYQVEGETTVSVQGESVAK